MHRVRVGLIGLCSVFLLVMLAAAVFRVTTEAPPAENAATAVGNLESPAEPLAQLGVVPGYAPPEENTVRFDPPPARPAHK